MPDNFEKKVPDLSKIIRRDKPVSPREKINDKQINEKRGWENPTPLSWQPIVDETDSTPPSGGSGILPANSNEN